jgi:hypothetical protein
VQQLAAPAAPARPRSTSPAAPPQPAAHRVPPAAQPAGAGAPAPAPAPASAPRAAQPGPPSRINITSKELGATRGRFDGPLIGQDTLGKVLKALKAYEARTAKTPELPLARALVALTHQWLDENPAKRGKTSQQREMMIQLDMEAERQVGVLRAEQVYFEQASSGALSGLSHGATGSATVGAPIAQKVVEGTSTGAMAFGIGPQAEQVAADTKMNAAELAAFRIFTHGDYKYINPGVEQNRAWMFGQNANEILGIDPDTKPDPNEPKVTDTAWAPLTKDADERMKAFMEEGQLHAGVLAKAADKLPVWRGVCFRGARFAPDQVSTSFAVGKKLTYKTFASTSQSKQAADKFASGKGGDVAPAADRTASVLVILTIRNGRDIQQISAAAKGEREILVLPGAEFTITGINEHKTGVEGTPPATHWYTVTAIQSDAAAMQRTPDEDKAKGIEEPKTAGGTALPKDALSQLALAEARKTIDAAIEAEPTVTAALRATAKADGGKLAGLENKFKSEPSLARKIADKVRTRVTSENMQEEIDKEMAKIYDALRYTITISPKKYRDFAYDTLPQALQKKQMARVNHWDAWADADTYKGINQAYTFTSGYPPVKVPFEVQIHTDASFKMKTANHEMYEEARSSGVSNERRAELNKVMTDRWKGVKTPAGIRNKGAR